MADVQLSVHERQRTVPKGFVSDRAVCPRCGAACSMKHQAAEGIWHHLDAMQFQTILMARVPRCSRETCGVKTIAIPLPDKHSRFTLLFEAFAIDALQASQSIQFAALLLAIDWSTAQVIIKRDAACVLTRRSFDQARHVGIHGKCFGKGKDYVTVMTEIYKSRVLDVTPDRTTESIDALWNTLSRMQRRK